MTTPTSRDRSVPIELQTEKTGPIVIWSSGPAGPAGSGSFDGVHNDITGRTADDAHPISAITGLQDALANAGTTVVWFVLGYLRSADNTGSGFPDQSDIGGPTYVDGDLVWWPGVAGDGSDAAIYELHSGAWDTFHAFDDNESLVVVTWQDYTGGAGTWGPLTHNDLADRDALDAHPISSITGLQDALDNAGGGGTSAIPVSLMVLGEGDIATIEADMVGNTPAFSGYVMVGYSVLSASAGVPLASVVGEMVAGSGPGLYTWDGTNLTFDRVTVPGDVLAVALTSWGAASPAGLFNGVAFVVDQEPSNPPLAVFQVGSADLVGVDASAFAGNLDSSVDTAQALADAVDALTLGGGGGIPLSSIGLLDGERNRGYWDAGVADYAAGDVVFESGVWLAVTPATGVSPADPAWTNIGARAGLAVELGASASASGVYPSAIGVGASASGDYSSAVGVGASASGGSSSAIGVGASASGDSSSAIGAFASASGDGSSAIGPGASASGDGDVNLSHIVTGHVDYTSGPAPDGLVLTPGFADLPVTADATDPATDRKRLIARTDGLYVRDETGTEVGPLGAGGGGGTSAIPVSLMVLGEGDIATIEADIVGNTPAFSGYVMVGYSVMSASAGVPLASIVGETVAGSGPGLYTWDGTNLAFDRVTAPGDVLAVALTSWVTASPAGLFNGVAFVVDQGPSNPPLAVFQAVSADLVTVDASGFVGNLDSSVDTAQALANAVDALTVSGGGGGAVLADVTLTSAQATVLFTPIPNTYAHLILVHQCRSDASGVGTTGLRMTFNNDSGSNYNGQYMAGNNTSPVAAAQAADAFGYLGNIPAGTANAGYSASGSIEVPNYAGTAFFKNALFDATRDETGASGNMFSYRGHIVWKSTSAISRIDLALQAGNFVAGSRFTLYGVSGA